MSQNYEPNSFWMQEGKRVMYGLDEPRYKEQYDVLIPYLDRLQFDSILEIGAGDGRITDYLRDNYQVEKHTCVDFSADRKQMFLNNIKGFNPDDYINADFLVTEVPKADLVITCETLVHVRPERIEEFIKKMIDSSNKHVVFIEYKPKVKSTLVYYCFEHDYEGIIKKLGYKFVSKRVNEIQKLYHIEKA